MSDTTEAGGERDQLKRAILSLREMRARLKAAESVISEPIAVVGIGCRLPGGANSPAAFWSRLQDGFDAISEVPPDRWDVNVTYDPDRSAIGKMYTRCGAFVEGIQEFDRHLFRMSPAEARALDPQHRMLMEVGWEALEHAGIVPDEDAGSATGVFVGLCTDDYQHHLMDVSRQRPEAFAMTGGARSIAAGRLSHFLRLHGPCLTIDTACSSSLVAVHLACDSLRRKECRIALAGGVNAILSPVLMIGFCQTQVLSPDGRCRSFDAAAEGYGRGEGCGIAVLKRLSDARADNDRILALIRGTAVNHAGGAGGLTMPSGRPQAALIRAALAAAGVEPQQVGYVEAHGTASLLSDAVELRAIHEVLASERPPDSPLVVGTVKTNIGHLEAAAGIVSLIKAVLCVYHGKIPPNLHQNHLNPYIAEENLAVLIPGRSMPWPDGSGGRIAGVSALGFNGTNAHAIVEACEAAPDGDDAPSRTRRAACCLALSAETAASLHALASRYIEFIDQHPDTDIGDLCMSANTGRAQMSRRLAIVADSISVLRNGLESYIHDQQAEDVWRGSCTALHSSPPEQGGSDKSRAALAQLAQHWVNGGAIDWRSTCSTWGARIDLPTYAFDRERYWLEIDPKADRMEKRGESAAPNTVEVSTDLRRTIREIWGDLLGLPDIGLHDNFFDLGGRSLQAIQFLGRLEKITGHQVPLSALVDANTVALVAKWIGAVSESCSRSLVAIQAEGTRRPFYCVHPGGGTVLVFHSLARRLGNDQPFYGLQALGLDGSREPQSNLKEIAQHYLSEIKDFQPHGPYCIGGMCWGSVVAFEMAHLLLNEGDDVALLALIDGQGPPRREDGAAQSGKLLKILAVRSWLYGTNRLRALSAFSRYIWSAQGRRIIYIEHLHARAKREYRARVYPGDMHLFRTGQPDCPPIYETAWARLTNGTLHTHCVEGIHNTIIEEPFVRSLAEQLDQCLRNAH